MFVKTHSRVTMLVTLTRIISPGVYESTATDDKMRTGEEEEEEEEEDKEEEGNEKKKNEEKKMKRRRKATDRQTDLHQAQLIW